MRKLTLALLLPLGMLVVSAGIARAQTADEVIERHIAALGGREALNKLTSRKSTGTVTLGTAAGNLTGPYEGFAKAPNKTRSVLKLDTTAIGGPGEMIIEQRFDGNAGYSLNSLQGDADITGNQLDNMRNGGFPSAILVYKQNGVKADLLPKEQVDGKDAIVMLLTPKTGSPTRIYFDATTYLVIKTVVKVTTAAGELEQTNTVSDYRTVDGVKVPFLIANSNPQQTITIKLTKVEHNIPLDDAMFGKR